MEVFLDAMTQARENVVAQRPQDPDLPFIDEMIEQIRANTPISAPEPAIKVFSAATLKDLKRNHAVVLDPLEMTLARMKRAERPFRYIINEADPNFMNLLSRGSQIAFFPEDPNETYVPESNRLSLSQLRELQKVDLAEVVKPKWGIGGIDMVVDNVATHAGLVFALYDRPGRIRLHGPDYKDENGNFRWVRTETSTNGIPADEPGSNVASVGRFAGLGLGVNDWSAGLGNGGLWGLRLVVPGEE